MTQSLLAILPIIVPLSGAAMAMFMQRNYRLQAAWAFGAMLTSFAATMVLLGTVYTTGQPVVFQMGGWPAPFGISINPTNVATNTSSSQPQRGTPKCSPMNASKHAPMAPDAYIAASRAG